MKFRTLKADEIEVRVATVSNKGISALLYKDARVDMNLLDETVGSLNWQRSHEVVDGRLCCTISIWDEETALWVSKQDVGTESYTEKDKGQFSDAFKRAGFNWGIGRELYTAPFIWITDCEIVEGKNGKPACYDKFLVNEIGYDDNRRINKLVIENAKTHDVVYTMGARKKKVTKKTGARSNDKGAPVSNDDAPKADEDAPSLLKKYHKTLYEKGWVKSKLSTILKQAGWDGTSQVDDELIAKATTILMEIENEARQ